MDIGEKIKLARKRLGLNQPGLAARLKCTRQEVWRLEGSTDLRHSTIERVARALNMRPSELIAIGERNHARKTQKNQSRTV